MAKAHSGGPGTYTSGQVNCTMDPPFKDAKRQPEGTRLKSPFDGGASSAPFNQRVSDSLGGRQSPSQVAPSQQGQKREGTKEYPYGGGGMRDGKAKR